MSFFSNFGQEYGIYPVFILSIGFLPKGDTFLMLIALTVSTCFFSAQKMYHKEPRPYVLETNNVCSKDMAYGYPSGHSLTPLCFWFVTLHCLVKNQFVQNKALGAVVVALLVMCIMFSRLYKGVHSYDQLFAGALEGFILASILTLDLVYQWILYLRTNIMKKKCGLCLFVNPVTVSYGVIVLFGYLYCYSPVTTQKVENVQDACKNDSLDLKGLGPEQASLGYLLIPFANFVGCYLGSIFQIRYMSEESHLRVETITDGKRSINKWATLKRCLWITLTGVPLIFMHKLMSNRSPYFNLVKYFVGPCCTTF